MTKGPEPRSLIRFRASAEKAPQPTLDQADAGVKGDLRRATARDQHGLCCYCERRLDVRALGMKIEHFVPQSSPAGVALRLQWSNLHGACLGGAGLPPSVQTCDTRKADQSCALDPLQVHDEHFQFSADGTVKHLRHQSDLDGVLNLNAAHLVRSRKQALRHLKARLQRQGYSAAALRAELAALEGNVAPAHAGLIAYWVRKKQRQQG